MKKNDESYMKRFRHTCYAQKRMFSLLVLIFLSVLTSQLSAQDVKISISMKNKQLSEVLSQIEAKSGYSVLIRKNNIDTGNIVSVEATNKTIDEVLSTLFKNTGISYTIKGRNITIFRSQPKTEKKPVKVSGKVVDRNGDPVIGAVVLEKGTSNGIATEVSGEFSLYCTEKSTLQITLLGYKVKEVVADNQKENDHRTRRERGGTSRGGCSRVR